MRNAFADEITRLAGEDSRIVLLSGDIGNRLFNKFREQAPDRFYNCGVAEANMMGTAAGLAMSGLRPVAYTITPFITTRCLEQIKLDVCYQKLPVVFVAVGAGLSYASLGPTHHSFEDLAILRVLPNLAVVCPADPWEVRAALRAALHRPGPVYLRLGKKGEAAIHAAPPEFGIGCAIVLRHGKDVGILATGNLVAEALAVADLLEAQGVACMVVDFHTVKPLDEKVLHTVFSDTRLVATMEEHSLIGGFGSAVAEWLADHAPFPTGLVRFGMRDEFLHQAGNQKFARRYFGLDAEAVAARIAAKLNK